MVQDRKKRRHRARGERDYGFKRGKTTPKETPSTMSGECLGSPCTTYGLRQTPQARPTTTLTTETKKALIHEMCARLHAMTCTHPNERISQLFVHGVARAEEPAATIKPCQARPICQVMSHEYSVHQETSSGSQLGADFCLSCPPSPCTWLEARNPAN